MKNVYGYVAKDGKIKSGSENFTVVRGSTGKYTVTFAPGTFTKKPAVSIAQIYYGKQGYETKSGGNAVTASCNQDKIELVTRFNKMQFDRDFLFMAVGKS